MPDPEFWARVRAQREAQQPTAPHDRVLWTLVKGAQRAEAVVRVVEGLGQELRLLHNGDLRRSQIYRDDGWEGAAIAVKAELEAKGWHDPQRLAWGR